MAETRVFQDEFKCYNYIYDYEIVGGTVGNDNWTVNLTSTNNPDFVAPGNPIINGVSQSPTNAQWIAIFDATFGERKCMGDFIYVDGGQVGTLQKFGLHSGCHCSNTGSTCTQDINILQICPAGLFSSIHYPARLRTTKIEVDNTSELITQLNNNYGASWTDNADGTFSRQSVIAQGDTCPENPADLTLENKYCFRLNFPTTVDPGATAVDLDITLMGDTGTPFSATSSDGSGHEAALNTFLGDPWVVTEDATGYDFVFWGSDALGTNPVTSLIEINFTSVTVVEGWVTDFIIIPSTCEFQIVSRHNGGDVAPGNVDRLIVNCASLGGGSITNGPNPLTDIRE